MIESLLNGKAPVSMVDPISTMTVRVAGESTSMDLSEMRLMRGRTPSTGFHFMLPIGAIGP